jgi:hypothetical protein
VAAVIAAATVHAAHNTASTTIVIAYDPNIIANR